MGKWTPHDDYLLIQGVMQLMSLDDVHKVIKFSQKFTAKELEDRWYAVLYDVPISKYASHASLPFCSAFQRVKMSQILV